ncbi:MAG: ATP-binding protein, partial [Ruthenibacterium sp.]
MANELEVTQAAMDKALSSSLDSATAIITKNYLDRLELYDLIPPSEEDIDIDVAECGKFYKLTKLVVNQDENFLNKLTTIVNVASSIDCSLATVIRSNGKQVEYFFGVISKRARDDKEVSRKRRAADAKAFYGALSGNLIGSDLAEISKEEVSEFKTSVFGGANRCFSAVSGIVALRDEEEKRAEGYVQGIENLVDSLAGQQYTIMMIADPVSTSELQVMKRGYELLYTQLAAFLKCSVTFNEGDTLSLTKARTEGVTEGISKGISMTQSQTNSKGSYFGANASIGVNLVLSASAGVAGGTNRSTANTRGRADITTELNQQNKSITDTFSSGKTAGKSFQLNYENRSARSLLDKIDKQLERLDECESFGAFDCAAYV